MAIRINWLQPGRVALTTIFGEVVADDVMRYSEIYNQLARETMSPPLHMIVYTQDTTTLSLKVQDLMETLKQEADKTRFGWTIIVTQNRLLQFFVTVTERLTGTNFKTVNTLEDALASLKRVVLDVDISLEDIETIAALETGL